MLNKKTYIGWAVIIILFCVGTFLLLINIALAPESFSKLVVKESSPEVQLLVVGDLMFDRLIRRRAEQYGNDYIFSCIKDDLLLYDAVIANLEGPITPHVSKSLSSPIGSPGNTRFTFPLSLPHTLALHNINIVNLANNHIRDFGPDGVISTKNALESADVSYFGDEPKALVKNINGVTIAFIGYDEWFLSMDDVVEEIRRHADMYPVIVYAHWGDEYVPAPERVKVYARQFADAGADIIIGSHPHIVQESEVYNRLVPTGVKSVPIYYSLGNFIFDQYFSEEVKTGLALEIAISKEGVHTVTPRVVNIQTDGRTCFANSSPLLEI